ncbi:MAG TPA: hypothetical protein VEU29_08065 [Actinomycetota bacterium]|nr:hypothetical protein [Actinomycetota bacterium]
METQPAEPSAPYQRVPLGVVNPLSVAVAVVLLSAGGAFGWRMKTTAPSARPTPEVAAAALALERGDAQSMCASRGMDEVLDQVLRGPSNPEPARLSEYLPRKSPLPGYGQASAHAIDPSTEREYVSGAVEGHVASFRPEGEGGFDVYAYRFLTRRAAADAVAGNVVRRVCEFGATPLTAQGRAGMIVLEEDGRGEWSSAWWTNESDVIVVKYGGWGDAKTSLANLAAIAGATALF